MERRVGRDRRGHEQLVAFDAGDARVAGGEVLGVVRHRGDVLVASRHPRAAVALAVGNRAAAPQVVPDAVGIDHELLVEQVVVGRPVAHRTLPGLRPSHRLVDRHECPLGRRLFPGSCPRALPPAGRPSVSDRFLSCSRTTSRNASGASGAAQRAAVDQADLAAQQRGEGPHGGALCRGRARRAPGAGPPRPPRRRRAARSPLASRPPPPPGLRGRPRPARRRPGGATTPPRGWRSAAVRRAR